MLETCAGVYKSCEVTEKAFCSRQLQCLYASCHNCSIVGRVSLSTITHFLRVEFFVCLLQKKTPTLKCCHSSSAYKQVSIVLRLLVCELLLGIPSVPIPSLGAHVCFMN
eukprot:scaffold113443_cov19-Tisochrysis_lutea.AAC.1